MTATDRLTLAAAVAALASGFALTPLTQDRSYLLLAGTLILASGVLGALLRRAGTAEPLVRLAQLGPVLLLPVFVPETATPEVLVADTVEYVQVAFAPMGYQVGFAAFCALLVWVVFLLTETLAVGLASPGWTFPVLVVPYAISALAIYVEASPFQFGFTAAGYALVLATSVRHGPQLARERDVTVARGWRRGVAAAAAGSTGLALVGMLLLSAPIPERSADWVNTGGSGTVQLGDPSIDLIRNVNSNSDRTLITYSTSDDRGHYLRLAALPVFDNRGFHLAATDLLPLPLPFDRPNVGTESVRTNFEVADFASEYLPVPWLPTAARAAGDWRYDPRTLAVVAVGDGRRQATRNASYEVTSERILGVEELLVDAAAGNPADSGMTLNLPPGIPPEVYQLAEQVTAEAETAGQKALALRDFLRSGAFRYSTAARPGTTLETLDDFLLGNRIGYCEQFAGSLATLARMVGIPSRVVVGFLPGRRVGENWEVSARNMHAWTELHFGDGIGWIPLDATPSGAVGNANETPAPSTSATPTTDVPSITPTADTPTAAPVTPIDVGLGGPSGLLGLAAGLAGGLMVVAAGPTVARRFLRWRRLAGSADPARAVENAWAETRALVVDRGVPWPEGTSRQVAETLGAQLEPEGSSALGALGLLVERVRFDTDPVTPGDLRALVQRVEQATEKRWASPTAWLRRWWPRSLWPQRPSS